ncbi:GGDEF domain-containing protein [Companilactobacillus jidongensis]|uniref:GGDEF domain-containing protein n=1 Tax=Companilactobacillus jidongensis TaxID=2486006 RepID=UPI000F7B209A|nr:GGDEF domain-containing protein [Companilactobacillus jidongensis]
MSTILEAGVFPKLLNVDANINAIIIGLITVGLVTILTVMSYSFEDISRRHKNRSYDIILGLTEGAVVVISMILVQHIFKALNAGSSTNWFYATTQMTLLLYSLYTMQNTVIEFVNIIAPLYIFGHHLFEGDTSYNVIFILALIAMAVTVIYIAHNKNNLLNDEWKYMALQIIYGGIWWMIIWPIYRFSPIKTIYILIGFIIYMSLIRFVAKWIRNSFNDYNNLSEKVNYDELTGVRNRANFDEVSTEVFKVYSKDKDIPLTVAMFDIDHFKKFNDNYGHMTGDKVLSYVASSFEHQLFQKTTRGQLFRYGGEEFIIIFRGLTDNESVKIIKDIRHHILDDPLEYNGESLTIRISFGISQLQPADRNFNDLFKRVDHYLYESKESGRNRITVEDETFTFN